MAMAALVTSMPALGQVDGAAPPAPTLNRYPQPWIGFLIIGVLAAALIAVSLIPSKRGHQD